MEQLLEVIQKEQRELLELYNTTQDNKIKEEIRKKLFLLSAKYLEVGKNIKPID